MALAHCTQFPCYYMLPTGKLYKKENWWLEERAAAALEQARNAYQSEFPGEKFVISDAGRYHYQQEAVFEKKGPKWAAKPGFSWHEAGLAVDVNYSYMIRKTFKSQAKLEEFMARFGYIRTVHSEPWHFEYHKEYARLRGVTGAIQYINNAA